MKRRARERSFAAALLAAGALCVAAVRADLFATHKRVKEEHDVYVLPPPGELTTLSLGYRAALADVLWAHVLVSQGLHTFEKRRFENLQRLYDAINALDPTWRSPYLYTEALLTFQASTIPVEDVLEARRILERGTEHRPNDPEMWLHLGQYVAFVAPPSYLEETRPLLAQQWRIEGAALLQRAAELAGKDSNIAWQALGGASILERAGDVEGAVRFLERTYATTDDEELRADIDRRIERLRRARDHELAKLELRLRELEAEIALYERKRAVTDDEQERAPLDERLAALRQDRDEQRHALERERQEEADRALRQNEGFRARSREFARLMAELPFVAKNQALVLGPPLWPARCAGAGRAMDIDCASSWREWDDRFEAAWLVGRGKAR